MKLTCDAKKLAGALKIALGVVDSRNAKPILRDVLIEAGTGPARVSATDLEVSVSLPIEGANTLEAGAAVVPGDVLKDVASASRGQLRMEWAGNILRVQSPSDTFKINGIGADEFPAIPREMQDGAFEVDGERLAEALGLATLCVADERMRYALNGVYVEISSGEMTVAAADGRRLCVLPLGEVGADDCIGILPLKAVKAFCALGKADAYAAHIGERQMMLCARGAAIVAQLIAGRFPPYEEVIPHDDGATVLEADVAELTDRLVSTSIIASRDSAAVTLRTGKGKLYLTAAGADIGDVAGKCDCTVQGKPVKDVRFNPGYLLDALTICGASARMHLYGAGKGAKIEGDAGRLCIVMSITED